MRRIWNGMKWTGSQLSSRIKGIFFRAVNWFAKLPFRLKRLISHLWNGVRDPKPWSLAWWKSLGNTDSWKNLLEWLGTSVIYVAELAGAGEIYETVMEFIKLNTRPLTGAEIEKARRVFGKAIPYDLVRIDEKAVIGSSWTGRPYTSFHTINSWGAMDDAILIHELTHVWQYEKMGAIYMPKAIHAQNTDGYEYGGVQGLRDAREAGRTLSSFNLEQQGQILEDYARNHSGDTVYEFFVNQVRE